VTIEKLEGTIQNYAWGSLELLPKLLGRPVPSAAPEAELWFGTHPNAPSSVRLKQGTQRLDELVEQNGLAQLGAPTLQQFGQLPFLLKILAVARPLSIQAHPSAEQARAGFRRERAQGISPSDPHANYRDEWPKPELLCPLTEFNALCGFRPASELIRMFDALGGSCFSAAAQVLKNQPEPEALRELVSTWLTAKGEARLSAVRSGLDACHSAISRNEVAADAQLALELAALNPGDPGVLVALLLKHVHLSPGEGLFVPAGVMHAYLGGLAVEVMANSDNVLRGGLTPKHVDVTELLSVVRFTADLPQRVTLGASDGPEQFFGVEVPHFRVSRICVEPHHHWCASTRIGPELLLCVEGQLNVMSPTTESLTLGPGECAWVCAGEDAYCAAGQGTAYRVQVGSPSGSVGRP
jgi:mannose-6-phosphate isomerase